MPSAAILAGGQATRFGGRDKSALIVGGRTILSRQIAELTHIADDILIVGRYHPIHEPTETRLKPDPTEGTEIRLKPDPTGGDPTTGEADDGLSAAIALAREAGATVRQIPDTTPGLGPLGGLDAALAAARHDQVVIVACDMPFITARFLEFLLSLAGQVDAVVPRTEDGYHPLCAVYARACRPAVVRRLAEGKRAMTGLLDDIRVRFVEGEMLDAYGDRTELLANVNTPAALEAILAGAER